MEQYCKSRLYGISIILLITRQLVLH